MRHRLFDPATQRLSSAQIHWLLASLALVMAPHLLHLPLWVGLLGGAGLGARLVLLRFGWPRPPAWLLLVLALIAALAVVAAFGTIAGRDAGVAMLVLMTGLKAVEMRTHREGMIVIFLGYFLVVTNFLFSQSLLAAGYMMLVIVVMTANLIALNATAVPRQRRALLSLALTLLAQALPVMAILFLLVPRLPGPLWVMPNEGRTGLTGLSETMSPGSIAELSRSGAVAFRVDFSGLIPPQNQLYWRALVLTRFDGRTWRAVESSQRASAVGLGAGTGDRIRYTVFLEPHGRKWLFLLEEPAVLPGGATMTNQREVRTDEPVNQVTRYRAVSLLQDAGASAIPQPATTRLDLARALALPEPAVNPRARELGRAWRDEGLSGAAIVDRALTRFSSQDFRYTLSPPALGAAPVDEFLFGTRAGFCEHFAGSFVVLMRAAGVPARVVTGYQGGNRDTIGDYLVVRQSEAHAWAEVWLDGRGWVRVDPTGAVSPERVDRSLADALTGAQGVSVFARRDGGPIYQLTRLVDAVNNSWNEWVLGYGEETQRELLEGLGIEDWPAMIGTLIAALVALTGLYALALSLQARSRGERDGVVRAYERFRRKLARRGVEPSPGEPPSQLAERASVSLPELRTDIQRIIGLYNRLRYGRDRPEPLVRQLHRRVRRFRPQRRARGAAAVGRRPTVEYTPH